MRRRIKNGDQHSLNNPYLENGQQKYGDNPVKGLVDKIDQLTKPEDQIREEAQQQRPYEGYSARDTWEGRQVASMTQLDSSDARQQQAINDFRAEQRASEAWAKKLQAKKNAQSEEEFMAELEEIKETQRRINSAIRTKNQLMQVNRGLKHA